MLRRGLEEHMKKECTFKKIPCEYCGSEQSQPLMEEHCNTTCTKFPLKCPKGCGNKVPRSEMENHLARDCPKAESACPLVGQCDFQGSRADIKKHMAEKQVEHAAMVTDRMSSMETNLGQIQNSIQHHQEAVDNETKNYSEELASLRDDVATLRAVVDRSQNRSHEVEESARPLPAGEPQGAGKPDADEMKDVKTRLQRLEDQVKQILVRERQALGRGQIGGQTGDNANETVSELERRVAAMEHQTTLSEVEMADHDLKIGMLETTSYDGIFFWKIDDFGRRLQDAVAGRCLSIYSPQFYVGRYGYKVCCRVYLNGDGMGKGTHLSLFFVVMRGAYDALLPWPFQQKVSFKLIDQTGDQHIIDSFRPDPNSSSFQRPTSNMNIASGCPLFVPKSVLHSRGYIRDEKVFFKITVDPTGLPIH
ncbi:TNF receptor-associated factor 3-like [Paramuricea clavata]|nr:TNF receptor-associated factor 3-like [Paramuricea clavata]